MRWHPIGASAPLDKTPFFATINEHTAFFDPARPLVVARAPGRLDVMGGIADYSGALVLELPLDRAAWAAAQLDDAPAITIHSVQAETIASQPDVTIALAALAPAGVPLDYGAARALLAADPRTSWAAYIAGALVVLARERAITPTRGLRLLLDSQVPPGKGVSSSAAIEVAAMRAICAVYDITLTGSDLALLCQTVENRVVGAPCGVMDQMTAACGEQDQLLALLCQPAQLQPPVALPAQLELWGIDSGIRHAVSGADYGAVRIGAFMGYRMIAELAGLTVRLDPARPGLVAVDDPHWGGYLANLTPSLWEQRFRVALPEAIAGADFLERYRGTTDSVTQIDPARSYAVRQPTAHPIYEHARVRLFRSLLAGLSQAGQPPAQDQGAYAEESYRLLGELMYQSHASYSACGLGSDGTDQLVELVREAGPAQGLYGAKITGGGSGGTVAVLARRGAQAEVQAIATHYAQLTGHTPVLLHGSSPGAQAFGVIWMET